MLAVYQREDDNIEWQEQHLYGSARLGTFESGVQWYPGSGILDEPYFITNPTLNEGWKQYEISNHLGNVLSVVNDRKVPQDTNTDGTADYYEPTILSASDYYPFGMEMPGRKYNVGDYRFGFNGKEKDQNGEWGGLTQYDYGFRVYNPAIARFLSVDPLTSSYPWYTPYQFAGNMPIWAIDLDGLEPVVEGGAIIGYAVTAGQGPSQIAADINNPQTQKKYGYTLAQTVRWEEIVDNRFNLGYFDHIKGENRYNRRNEDYKNLNLNPGDHVSIFAASKQNIPSPALRIDLGASDKELLKNTLYLMRNFSVDYRWSGGEFLESGRYNMDDFLTDSKNKFGRDPNSLLEYFTGVTDGIGYKKYEKSIHIGADRIGLSFVIPEDNKLASTEVFEKNKIVTYGMLYSSGGKTRHITVNFGKNSALFNQAVKYIRGELTTEQLLNKINSYDNE